MMLFFSVLLGCYILDVVHPVVSGLFQSHSNDRARVQMNESVRFSSTALAVLGMLAVASAAAVSLTDEREQDTWISLATTLLTPSEIVRGKQFGAIWSARRIGLALLILWSLGILLGAVHPVGVVVAIGICGLACWFIAAIGVFMSTRARNSTRALTLTFIALFIALFPSTNVLWQTLFSYADLAPQRAYSTEVRSPFALMLSIFSLAGYLFVIYGTATLILTAWSIRRLRASWGQS